MAEIAARLGGCSGSTLRQDRRWLVLQSSPGRFEWTTPSNRTYIREPIAA
jgi:hypothetical protein